MHERDRLRGAGQDSDLRLLLSACFESCDVRAKAVFNPSHAASRRAWMCGRCILTPLISKQTLCVGRHIRSKKPPRASFNSIFSRPKISSSFFFFFTLCLSFLPSPPCRPYRENKMFSENEIRNITFQVLTGLVFVHKHGKKDGFTLGCLTVAQPSSGRCTRSFALSLILQMILRFSAKLS